MKNLKNKLVLVGLLAASTLAHAEGAAEVVTDVQTEITTVITAIVTAVIAIASAALAFKVVPIIYHKLMAAFRG